MTKYSSSLVKKSHEYQLPKRNSTLKALITTSLVVIIITIVAVTRFLGDIYGPSLAAISHNTPILGFQSTRHALSNSIDSFSSSSYFKDIEQDDIDSIFALAASVNDEPPEPKCEDVNDVPTTEDRCEWVKDNCESESLINYLKFSYCSIGSVGFFRKFAALTVFAFALVILLQVLASTADIFFVPSLTVVASELKLSPAVAGLTLLSLANGSPDLITSIQAVRSGAEDGEIGLVLGSLSGAVLAIGALVLGLSIIAAHGNGQSTRIGRGAFLRYMSGFVLCIVPSIAICWTGSLRWFHGVIFMLTYVIFAAGSVIYLQRDEKKKRIVAKQLRKEAFIRTTASYRFLNPTPESEEVNTEFKSGLLADVDEQSDMSHAAQNKNNGKLTQEEVELNFLTGKPIDQYENDVPSLTLNVNTDPTHLDLVISDLDENASPGIVNNIPVHRLDADPTSPTISTSPFSPVIVVDDGDDEDDEDQTYYMAGLFFDPAWIKENENGKRDQNVILRNLSRVLWFVCWPFALLRWLTIPSTDHRPDYLRGLKRIVLHCSPIFLSFLFGINLGFSFSNDGLKWGIIISTGAGTTLAMNLVYFFIVQPSVIKYNRKRAEMELYVDSKRDQSELTGDDLHEISEIVVKYHLDGDIETAKPIQMTLFMIFVSGLAFVGSIIWLSLIANEIVAILSTIGSLFGLSPTFLGLTVLAIGNSIPDAASDIALAKSGKLPIAYSAIFSAPTLSSSFGLGLAIFLTTIRDVDVIEFNITSQILLCWIAVLTFIGINLFAFPWVYNYIPTKKFGWMLCGFYGVFMIVAVALEISGK